MTPAQRLICFCMLVAACSTPEKSPAPISSGSWVFNLHRADGIAIPFEAELEYHRDSVNLTITNATERIVIPTFVVQSDSLRFSIPGFASDFALYIVSPDSLSGSWTVSDKNEPYSMSVSAKPGKLRFNGIHHVTGAIRSGKWKALFSPKHNPYPGIGIFRDQHDHLTGTFATETGDYRFLAGACDTNHLYLSCFDGAHAFLFTANIYPDSLGNGMFYSGKTWKTGWHAVVDPDAALTPANELTYTVSDLPVTLTVKDLQDSAITLDEQTFAAHSLTLIQIMGTWCPNCMDESLYYSDLYNRYHDRGLEIIALCFERPNQFEAASGRIKNWQSDLGIPYPAYYAGTASKSLASQLFPMLNQIISFPTTLFIDQEGQIQKIHTGFYGPGTGQYYDRYVSETEAFIASFLSEPNGH